MNDYSKVNELSKRIAFYKENDWSDKRVKHYHASFEANLWGLPQLFSRILLRSRMLELGIISLELAEEQLHDFNLAQGTTVNLKDLLNRGWLREVMAEVQVAHSVRQLAGKVSEFLTYQTEFEFLSGISTNEDGLEKEVFEELIKKYESDHSVFLDLSLAKSKIWSIDKNDKIKVWSLDSHRILAAHLDEFRFLNVLLNLKRCNSPLVILYEVEEIVRLHRDYFPECPDYDFFVSKEVFTTAEGSAVLAVSVHELAVIAGDLIYDQIAALFWNLVVKDDSFENDRSRLLFWFVRLIRETGSADPIPHLNASDKNGFLNGALDLVLSEKDLGNGIPEYRKMRLDEQRHHGQALTYDYKRADEDIDFDFSTDYFQLFHGLTKYSEELFEIHYQPCREGLGYFIREVVIYDTLRYEKIHAMLEAGASKPWLFSQVCFCIYYWVPELIPYLLLKQESVSLAFLLIMQMEISRDLGNEGAAAKNNLVLDCFGLLVKMVADDYEMEEKVKAKIIYQCLLRSTEKKFSNRGASQGDAAKFRKQNQIEMCGKVRDTFSRTKLGGTVFSGHAKFHAYFFPRVLAMVFELVSNYTISDADRNGFLDLEKVKLDLLPYLLELTRSLTEHDVHYIPTNLKSRICNEILRSYLGSMKETELRVKDYFGDKTMKFKLGSWSPSREQDLLIPWADVLLALHQEYLVDEFISPSSLTFSDSPDQYDSLNQLTAKKLRTHLAILLDGYKTLSENSFEKSRDSISIKQLLPLLESKITSYASRYCMFDPTRRRFDLFNDLMERGLWQGSDAELIPVIGTMMSRFSKENKRSIIESLMASGEIVRTLKLLEFVVGEDERNYIITEIQKHFQRDFFKSQRFIDLQYIVSELSEQEQFRPQAEASLAHAEKLVTKRRGGYDKDEDKVFIYRMRLLLAYYKKDQTIIDAVDAPEVTTHMVSEFSAVNERDFYKALLFLEDKQPDKAYNLFNKLFTYEKNERPVLALNRFASRIRWAISLVSETERFAMLREAFAEWMGYENKAGAEDWRSVRHNVWHNKLYVYSALGEEVKFDSLYLALDPSVKMRPDFLGLRIDALMKRHMHSGAEKLLEEAQQFHRLENGTFPSFMEELSQMVNPEETVDLLTRQYLRIFSRPPEILIKIVPDHINKRSVLPEFLLQELVNASNDMLRLINSISKIEYEDKFSDLLKLALGSRLINYHWLVEGIRSGQSDKDGETNNPGEIDFAIQTANGQIFAICEAFRLKGKNTVETQRHVLKVLNYDAQRQVFYMIVYYEGITGDFGKYWAKYCKVIEDFIEFPVEFAPTSKVLGLDDFGNNSVRVGKSEHGPNTSFYHLFININYLLPLVNKKVGDVKVEIS